MNNVGGNVPRKLLALTADDWQQGFEQNFFSAVRLALACVPGMRAQRWGRIINIASTSAREPDPYFGPYAAAKAALVNFSKNLSMAFAPDGVLSNAVLPGVTMTDAIAVNAGAAAERMGVSSAEVMERMMAAKPVDIGRFGEPSEISAAVVFLASERASWITGACFVVDGGTLHACQFATRSARRPRLLTRSLTASRDTRLAGVRSLASDSLCSSPLAPRGVLTDVALQLRLAVAGGDFVHDARGPARLVLQVAVPERGRDRTHEVVEVVGLVLERWPVSTAAERDEPLRRPERRIRADAEAVSGVGVAVDQHHRDLLFHVLPEREVRTDRAHEDGGVDAPIETAGVRHEPVHRHAAEGDAGSADVIRCDTVLERAGHCRAAHGQHLRDHEAQITGVLGGVGEHRLALIIDVRAREERCRDHEAGACPGVDQLVELVRMTIEAVREDDERERRGGIARVADRRDEHPLVVAGLRLGRRRRPARVHERERRRDDRNLAVARSPSQPSRVPRCSWWRR